MRYLWLFGVVMFLGSMPLQAHATTLLTPDSSKYKWIKGEKFLLHKVRSRETWNGIARKYNMSISDVMRANMGVIDLKAGQILNIPAGLIDSKGEETHAAETPDKEPPAVTASRTAVLYTVHEGETLYGISKKFNTSVKQLQAWNQMNDDIVRKGEKIVVSYSSGGTPEAQSTDGSPPPSAPVSAPETPAVEEPDMMVEYSREVTPIGKARGGKKLSKVSETGICSWISDGSVNQSKFYALHRTAPPGTIMKVTNKMNDQHVFVKVVGLLPDTGDNKNSIIKISETAVKKLGALDKQFLVELTYGVTN